MCADIVGNAISGDEHCPAKSFGDVETTCGVPGLGRPGFLSRQTMKRYQRRQGSRPLPKLGHGNRGSGVLRSALQFAEKIGILVRQAR